MKNDIDSQVKQAAKELGVDKPIMSFRAVGNRLELHLLGGSVAVWSRPLYQFKSLAELKQLARRHKIPGRSKMNRAHLIQALEEIE